MTKQQEIEILTKTIAALGTDSYLGPWLAQIKGEVQSLICSDIFPDITLASSAMAANVVRIEAGNAADKIIADANTTAKRIQASADRYVNSCREALHKALREINR